MTWSKARQRSTYTLLKNQTTIQVNRLQDEDPNYLEELEREALLEDPEIFAEMITHIISKDEDLLKEIVAKLSEDKELMADASDLLADGETLENKPEVVGILLAKYLSEDPSLLDEFEKLFDIEVVDEDNMDTDGIKLQNTDDGKDEL